MLIFHHIKRRNRCIEFTSDKCSHRYVKIACHQNICPTSETFIIIIIIPGRKADEQHEGTLSEHTKLAVGDSSGEDDTQASRNGINGCPGTPLSTCHVAVRDSLPKFPSMSCILRLQLAIGCFPTQCTCRETRYQDTCRESEASGVASVCPGNRSSTDSSSHSGAV